MERYPFDRPRVGHAVLIGNVEFPGGRRLPGSRRNVEALSASLERLGFIVHPYPDCTAAKIEEVIVEWSGYDHSDCNCFLFYFSGHGGRDVVCGTDGETVMRDEIEDAFKPSFRWCRSLKDRPKVCALAVGVSERVSNSLSFCLAVVLLRSVSRFRARPW